MLPVLNSASGDVYIADDDRKYGTLLVGGQGSGKTSAMLRMYLNDIRDPNAAVIVFDPKSELSRLALKLTPPDCGKRVYYLNLGRPAFGMTPLRMHGDQDFASEAAAVADGVVEALLDINEGQIFQASRDLLYRSVIGAVAYAAQMGRTPRFEDVYTLLLPSLDRARAKVAEAAAHIQDLDQTVHYFREELPGDLERSTSGTADRLRAPRNKIAGIVGVPSLRRFLNHPSDVPLRRIVEGRDILLIDANMADVGEVNAQACMHFIFRQLHRQMQRQVRLPEDERPRVAVLADEFHYLASRNVVRQIATHRAAGLDVTAGLQFLAQLGAGAESASVSEEIRSGVVNLLQSRFLFRLGDPRDAEEATRIAMAVYQSMIRSDPDSRAQMRVTPEYVLNLPRYWCVASWIVNGTRATSFTGQTFPMPADASEVWADLHLEVLRRLTGDYPDRMDLRPDLMKDIADEQAADQVAKAANGKDASAGKKPPRSAAQELAGDETLTEGLEDVLAQAEIDDRPWRPGASTPGAVSTAASGAASDGGAPEETRVAGQMTVEEMLAEHAHKPGADIEEDVYEIPTPDKSAVRAIFGNTARSQGELFRRPAPDTPLPETLRDLAFYDRINEVREAEANEPPETRPRIYATDLRIMQVLDRNGPTLPSLVGRLCMPGKSESQVRRTLGKLHKNGLVARHKIGITERDDYRGALPALYSLTRYGFDIAQEKLAIPERREFREPEISRGTLVPHDHHALAWYAELECLLGPEVAKGDWRTPRYATGRFPVPQIGNGHKRRPVTPSDIPVGRLQMAYGLDVNRFSEVKPDVVGELRVGALNLRFDVLVEYQANTKSEDLVEKFRNYDQFLTGWALTHRRFQALQTRPVVVVVAATAKDLLTLARHADGMMVGAIGVQGTPPADWYYASRDHIFFALEEDLHRGSLDALALPQHPASLRAQLGGPEDGLELTRVSLLPQSMAKGTRRPPSESS